MDNFFVANFADLIIAIVLDLILGDPYWFPHPVIFIGRLIKFIENKAVAIGKSHKALRFLGFTMVIIVVLICFALPAGILYITWPVKPLFHIVNIILLWTTIAARCLKVESMKVYHALEKQDIKLARKYTSYIVGRDTKNLSEEELTKATVETVAENTSDGVIAPLFYGIIGGAPLALMYKGINTMDSMVGYKTEPYTHFGFFPAKTDDVFNFLPARLTGFIMCITAPFFGSGILNSIKIMLRDRKNHKSPNSAYPEAATAAILKVQLGGDSVYFGKVVKKPVIGDSLKEISFYDIVSANRIMFFTEFLFVIIAAIIVMYLYFAIIVS